jgi:hypothetical protein
MRTEAPGRGGQLTTRAQERDAAAAAGAQAHEALAAGYAGLLAAAHAAKLALDAACLHHAPALAADEARVRARLFHVSTAHTSPDPDPARPRLAAALAGARRPSPWRRAPAHRAMRPRAPWRALCMAQLGPCKAGIRHGVAAIV